MSKNPGPELGKDVLLQQQLRICCAGEDFRRIVASTSLSNPHLSFALQARIVWGKTLWSDGLTNDLRYETSDFALAPVLKYPLSNMC